MNGRALSCVSIRRIGLRAYTAFRTVSCLGQLFGQAFLYSPRSGGLMSWAAVRTGCPLLPTHRVPGPCWHPNTRSSYYRDSSRMNWWPLIECILQKVRIDDNLRVRDQPNQARSDWSLSTSPSSPDVLQVSAGLLQICHILRCLALIKPSLTFHDLV